MPIYVFKCLKCGEKQEILVKRNLKFSCSKCGGTKCEIVPSCSNFVIKGYNSKNNYSKNKEEKE